MSTPVRAAVSDPPWAQPGWSAEITAWASDRLATAGMRLTGPSEPVHVRPWAVVTKLPTDAGPVWLKANAPDGRYEAAAVRVLASLAPDRLARVLGLDEARGWLLLADAGTRFADRPATLTEAAVWSRVLRSYGLLQRHVSAHADQLLAAGVPDHRPAALPERFRGLVAAGGGLAGPGAVPRGLLDHAVARARQIGQWCAELDAAGIAPSIQHDDLHDGNVFLTADGVMFIDWADSLVAHPFASLWYPLARAGEVFGEPLDGPTVCALRDAYLELWSGEHDWTTLRRAADLALRLVSIGRAEAWLRVLRSADAARLKPYHAEGVKRWLGRLLD